MQSISSLIKVIRERYPQFSFISTDTCRWSPDEQTIYYSPLVEPHDIYILFHELAHGLLDHRHFTTDIDLLKKEVEAWQLAKEQLGPKYSTVIPDSFIEDSLDTYRVWLHNRSLCPECSQNGVQTKNDTYECLNCRCRWRVNDARQCQLRRYTLSGKSHV